jgi:hypothetical protein
VDHQSTPRGRPHLQRRIPLLLALFLSFPRRPLCINLLFALLRSLKTIDIRPELDDFSEEVRGLLLPVGHCFLGVGVARRELFALLVDVWGRKGFKGEGGSQQEA